MPLVVFANPGHTLPSAWYRDARVASIRLVHGQRVAIVEFRLPGEPRRVPVVIGPRDTARTLAEKGLAEWKRVRDERDSLRRNPPPRRGRTLSTRAYEIAYRHAADGKAYKHEFAPGVTIELCADGSARIYRPDGKPVWKEF